MGLTIILYLLVGAFFGWTGWVMSPRHPERLKRLVRRLRIPLLRRNWRVNSLEHEDRSEPPSSNQGPFR